MIRCHSRTVKLLIAAGADVNAKTCSNETPLALAALHGHTDIVRQLINAGSAVNAVDHLTLSPLSRAVAWGHVDCVRLLLEAKADLSLQNAGTGNTALLIAVDRACEEVVQLLIQVYIDVLASMHGVTNFF